MQPKQLPLLKVLYGILLPSFISFVIMDGLWITVVANSMYQYYLKPILREPVEPVTALLSWVCIVTGCWLFAASQVPHVHSAAGGTSSIKLALVKGAVYGVIGYGIVDFTNAAIIEAWSWKLAVADLCWGTVGCSLLSAIQVSLRSFWLARP